MGNVAHVTGQQATDGSWAFPIGECVISHCGIVSILFIFCSYNCVSLVSMPGTKIICEVSQRHADHVARVNAAAQLGRDW